MPSDLLGEVTAGTNCPTQSVGKRKQWLVASGSIERSARVTEPRSPAETSTIVSLYQPSNGRSRR
jgi:hypothetical protein